MRILVSSLLVLFAMSHNFLFESLQDNPTLKPRSHWDHLIGSQSSRQTSGKGASIDVCETTQILINVIIAARDEFAMPEVQ